MILRAKIFLLWLLALAIPVQGFAAVLQACAPVMLQASAAGPAMHGMHHDMPMQADQPRHRHDHHPQADAASATPGDMQQDGPQHAQHKSSSCSYCAACTVGAVLPLAPDAPPAPDLPSREFIALPSAGFVGYLPENPDRPPSSI